MLHLRDEPVRFEIMQLVNICILTYLNDRPVS